MITQDDIQQIIDPGDSVQIGVKDIGPVIGEYQTCTQSSIILKPLTNKKAIEEFGDSPFDSCVIPHGEISIFFKISIKNTTDAKKEDRN